jgi:ubiquinone/menaquinone biosynthesis C-methylase UbiE
MSERSVRQFYDRLAADYHLIYPDWAASVARQGASLNKLISAQLGDGPQTVLDCACGIGTQAIGLAVCGHRVTGSDLSPTAAARANREAGIRDVMLATAACDMRRLPFQASRFDVVVCADNSLPHLLTAHDLHAALSEMRRVLRDDGLLMISIRAYEQARRQHPTSTAPQVSQGSDGQTITFQLWDWHADGEHYDLHHVQLLPDGETWTPRVRRTTYWALTQRQLTDYVIDAGFTEPVWHQPEESGFFQPLLTARAGARVGPVR